MLKIAIVGRPNVGKSSLFNRIAGSRRAIVEEASGTTRDRLYAEISRKNKTFTIIDTGGFEASTLDDITALTLKQLDNAIEEASAIFFVTDGKAGPTHLDTELASRLRKTSKKIYLIVNKVDDKSRLQAALEFFSLGLGEPYPVSALSGAGIDKLLDEAAENIELNTAPTGSFISVAIIGRPNVGKSSYLNAILGEERAIVHSVPGTTRDSLDTDFEYNGKALRLIDTAGMRHKQKLSTAADFYAIGRAREAIKRSDVVIALVDGAEGLREDDERVMEFCVEDGKPLIVAVNKSDLIKGIDESGYKEMLTKKMNAVRNFPVIFISCKTKKNITRPLDLIMPLYEKSNKKFSPDELANALEKLNNSPEIRNRRLKFTYLKQADGSKAAFSLGIKSLKYTNESLRRYTENFLRSGLGFDGIPLRVTFCIKKIM